jgi:hypothetical protein
MFVPLFIGLRAWKASIVAPILSPII